MSYPNGSIQVTGSIGTTCCTDTYATHLDYLGYGGARSIDTLADMCGITPERRQFGMTVNVFAESCSTNNGTYVLANSCTGGVDNNICNNANWIPIQCSTFGGGGGGGGIMVVGTGCCSTIRCGVNNIASGCYSAAAFGQCNTAGGNSNNIVLGGQCNIIYTKNSYSTISNGCCNTATGSYSTILNGSFNTASGRYSTISNGCFNISSGTYSTISNGVCNTTSGRYSTISNGNCNITCCNFSTVLNGNYNTASGYSSTILNGNYNTASVYSTTVLNGVCNTASGNYSTILNGYCNNASGNYSTISNGYCNNASGIYSTISNGCCNISSGDNSTISNGCCNTVIGNYSTISNGCCNTANGCNSTIINGICNNVICNFGFSFGYYNTVCSNYSGAFGCCLIAGVDCTLFVNNLCSCNTMNVGQRTDNLSTGICPNYNYAFVNYCCNTVANRVYTASIDTNFLNYCCNISTDPSNIISSAIAIDTHNFCVNNTCINVPQGSSANKKRVISAFTAQSQFRCSGCGTLTHHASMQSLGWYPDQSPTGILTVCNNYGMLINDQNGYTGNTAIKICNSWGLYQEGACDINFLCAPLLIGTQTNSGYCVLVNGCGRFCSSLTATAFYQCSDIRGKNIICCNPSFDNMYFEMVKFNYKDDNLCCPHYGYIAQDIQKIIPEVIECTNEGMMKINYTELHTIQIENLKKKISCLEAIIDLLMN